MENQVWLSVFLLLTSVDLTVKVAKETSYEEIMAVKKSETTMKGNRIY
jgi:hypothetical protein